MATTPAEKPIQMIEPVGAESRDGDKPEIKAGNGGGTLFRAGAREWRLIAAILILAAAIRSLSSFHPTLYYDELFTIEVAVYPVWRIIRLSVSDVHPPLYYLFERLLVWMGDFLGPGFHSIPWLRLGSVIPGVAAVAALGEAARRAWGREAGLLCAAALVVSPPMVYFSSVLRNYSLAQGLLALSAAFFHELLCGEPRRRWIALCLFTASMTAALFSNNLCVLYLAAFGAFWLWKAARPGSISKAAIFQSFFGLLISALIFSTWIPTLIKQRKWLKDQAPALSWGRAAWSDFYQTLVYYFPVGPLEFKPPTSGWPRALSLFCGAFFLLVAGIHAARLAARRADRQRGSARPSRDDLFPLCAVMFLAPLSAAFLVSRTDISYIFLSTRYNMIAAPFVTVFICRAILLLPKRPQHILMGVFLAGSAAASIYGQYYRATNRDDCLNMPLFNDGFGAPPGARVMLTNDAVQPWLAKCGNYRFESARDVLDVTKPPVGTVWALSTNVNLFSERDPKGTLNRQGKLEWALERSAPARGLSPPESYLFDHVWKVEPADWPKVRANLETIETRARLRRESMEPGTRLVAPDAPELDESTGFYASTIEGDGGAVAWTAVAHPKFKFKAGVPAGEYRVAATFRRSDPRTKQRVPLRYWLPGMTDWETKYAAQWRIENLESVVEIKGPDELLNVRFATPLWRPCELDRSSLDCRPLGMTFLSLTLTPVK